jgi:hypothetical protein
VVISTCLQFGGIVGALIAATIVVRLPRFLIAGAAHLAAAVAMLVLANGGTGAVFMASACWRSASF